MSILFIKATMDGHILSIISAKEAQRRSDGAGRCSQEESKRKKQKSRRKNKCDASENPQSGQDLHSAVQIPTSKGREAKSRPQRRAGVL